MVRQASRREITAPASSWIASSTISYRRAIGVSGQSATISDDTIYVVARGPEDSDSETLHPSIIKALRRANGSERWSYEFPVYEYEPDQGSVTLPPPAVAEETVYAASAGADTGDVVALSTTDGSVQWSVGVNSGSVSAPTVVGQSVYIGTSGLDMDSNQDGGRLDALTLYSLDRSTGSENWSYEAGAMWSPTIAEETIYVGYWNGFAALDATSGDIRWEYEPESDEVSSPAVTSESVYITDGNQLKAFDRANQELSWSFELDSDITSNPVVSNQSVFVSSSDGVLYAVGARNASTATSDGFSGSSDGSGSTNPAASPSSDTGAVQTNSLAQQQGTAGGNQNVNDETGGFPAWKEFGSSSSTLGIGVLGSALGLGGIYAAYRRYSRNGNSSNED